jgi:guanine nucleotide-binding protein G(I)/G(S)/G(T) subunit beta-1
MDEEQEVQALKARLRDLKLQRSQPVLHHLGRDLQITNERLELKVRRRLDGHFGKIYACEWGPDSQHLVSASQDANMFVWNAMLGLKTQGITLPSAWVMCCGYSPTGDLVATAGLDNVVWIYKVQEGITEEIAGELAGHEGYVSSCSFANEKQIITTSGDCSAALWDVPARRLISEFTEHSLDVNCSAIIGGNGGGQVFATGSCDASIKLWDVRTGTKSIRTFIGHTSDVNSLSFFPDGNAIISGSDDSTCRLFDIRSYAVLSSYGESEQQYGVTSSSISKSGRYVFASYDSGPVHVWNTVTAEKSQSLQFHDKRVSRVKVSPDGSAVATASWDTSLVIWA